MTSDEVEDAIRKNIIWAKLADELRIMLGNSQREYDKRILDYSIKNQLRYRDNIGLWGKTVGKCDLKLVTWVLMWLPIR